MKRTGLFCSTLAFLAAALATPTVHATVADDLCAPTDDPCIITGKKTVDAGSTLDFGTRTLRIADKASLTWSTNLTLTAGNCDFQPKSKVIEVKTSPGTGFLWMNCDRATLAGTLTTVGGGVLVEGNGPAATGPHIFSGVIRAVGNQVGVIAIDSAGVPGGITVTGKIIAKSKTGTPPGEFRLISNFGDVVIAETARITLKGATADPFYDFFSVEAGSGKLTVHGKIVAKASTGGYQMNFEGNNDVVFGPKSSINGTTKEIGAAIGINSQLARVALQGSVLASVGKVTSGKGARVRVCASGNILIDGGAKIDTSDGTGEGSIVVGSGGTTSIGTLLKGAKVFAKKDGDIEICSAGGVSVSSISTIKPDPAALGTGVCLSPNSQFIFNLDCNQ